MENLHFETQPGPVMKNVPLRPLPGDCLRAIG